MRHVFSETSKFQLSRRVCVCSIVWWWQSASKQLSIWIEGEFFKVTYMLGTEKSVLDKSASEVEIVGWIRTTSLWLHLLAFRLNIDLVSKLQTPSPAEIALRYYMMTLQDQEQWPTMLSVALNNSRNYSSTAKTAAEILSGFRTRETLDLLRLHDPKG